MKIYILSTMLALLLLPRLATAQGNLIANGSFSSNASGWIIVNTPGGFGYQSVGGNPGGCVLLDNVSPSPSSDPTASQTISSLTSGFVYVVSGDYQQGKDRGGGVLTDQSFGVAINSMLWFAVAAPGNFSWQHFSFSYTATSPTAVLSLSSQMNGTGVSYTIDNISLQAVPEPSVLCLVGFGIIFICWRMPWPNQSPEPTPVAAFGESRTHVARRASDSGWLSFFR
jgi:hypothetical protein